MRWSLPVSFTIHAAILLAAVVSLRSPDAFQVEVQESIPVDIVEISDATRLQAMQKNAPEETQKPAPPKTDARPDPEAEPRPEEPKRQAAIEPQAQPEPAPKEPEKAPEPAPAQAAPPAEPKPVDPKPLEELIQKTEALPEPRPEQKQPPKPVTVPREKPTPPKPVEAKPQPKFDPTRIMAELNKVPDKPTGAARPTFETGVARKANVNFLNGSSIRLSADEYAWLQNKMLSCWNIQNGSENARDLAVKVQINLNEDGSVSGMPRVVAAASSPQAQRAAEKAISAVLKCAPYDRLPREKYKGGWEEIIMNFDPRLMFAG